MTDETTCRHCRVRIMRVGSHWEHKTAEGYLYWHCRVTVAGPGNQS